MQCQLGLKGIETAPKTKTKTKKASRPSAFCGLGTLLSCRQEPCLLEEEGLGGRARSQGEQ